jgi:hypothetical protein
MLPRRQFLCSKGCNIEAAGIAHRPTTPGHRHRALTVARIAITGAMIIVGLGIADIGNAMADPQACPAGFTYNPPTDEIPADAHGPQCVGAPNGCPAGAQLLIPGNVYGGCCPAGSRPTELANGAGYACIDLQHGHDGAVTQVQVPSISPTCPTGSTIAGVIGNYLCVSPATCPRNDVLSTATGECSPNLTPILQNPVVPFESTPRSSMANCGTSGLVPRGAFPGDAVCVELRVHDQAIADNIASPSRTLPDGLCVGGYKWRRARTDDHVCVLPETRVQTEADNLRQCGNVRCEGSTAPPPIAVTTQPHALQQVPSAAAGATGGYTGTPVIIGKEAIPNPVCPPGSKLAGQNGCIQPSACPPGQQGTASCCPPGFWYGSGYVNGYQNYCFGLRPTCTSPYVVTEGAYGSDQPWQFECCAAGQVTPSARPSILLCCPSNLIPLAGGRAGGTCCAASQVSGSTCCPADKTPGPGGTCLGIGAPQHGQVEHKDRIEQPNAPVVCTLPSVLRDGECVVPQNIRPRETERLKSPTHHKADHKTRGRRTFHKGYTPSDSGETPLTVGPGFNPGGGFGGRGGFGGGGGGGGFGRR